MTTYDGPSFSNSRSEETGISDSQGKLETKGKNCINERKSSDYIKSWANATRGDSLVISTQDDSEEGGKPHLKFEIVSARTIDNPHNKKHVAYTVMLRRIGESDDPYPAVIERRYTDFLSLFNSLRKSHPDSLSNFQFPKKALMGNFSPEMISSRCAGFEEFLGHIVSRRELKESNSLAQFLNNRETIEGLRLIHDGQFDQARPLIENSFRLMNKLETDRAPVVLQFLCLLIGVCAQCSDTERTLGLAALAVRRYQGVSDVDLLRYYVPLLHTTIELCEKAGRDPNRIMDHLNDLKFKGINVKPSRSLLDIVLNDLFTRYNW